MLALQEKMNSNAKNLQPIPQEIWEQISISEEYNMESNLFNYEELKEQENFAIKKYNDAVYRGELVNGKRHGVGVMVYRKARVYEG